MKYNLNTFVLIRNNRIVFSTKKKTKQDTKLERQSENSIKFQHKLSWLKCKKHKKRKSNKQSQ